MITVLTQRQNIREYILKVKSGECCYRKDDANAEAKRLAVMALDPDTATLADLESIIGTQGGYGFGRIGKCGQCHQDSDMMVRFDNGAEYEFDWQEFGVCPLCLLNAKTLMTREAIGL